MCLQDESPRTTFFVKILYIEEILNLDSLLKPVGKLGLNIFKMAPRYGQPETRINLLISNRSMFIY